MKNQYIEKYFLVLFSLIPLSIIIGSTVSIINISILGLSFLFLMIYQRTWEWLFHPVIKLLFLLYLYLIFNSTISIDPEIGIYRNLGFFRFILLFAAFNYFFHHSKNFKFVILLWLITILVVFVDVFIEMLEYRMDIQSGKIDIVSMYRSFSFFIDEPIVGGYLNAFYLMLIGYLIYYNKKFPFLKNNYFSILLSLIFLSLIILTGERSNGIKALLGLTIFYFIYYDLLINKKRLFIFVTSFFLLISALSLNENLKHRYFWQYYVNLSDPKESQADGTIINEFKKRNIYYNLYKSGYKVFHNNPLFGVGNKNYRIEACDQKNLEHKYLCTTHPHQLYFEFLAEHGLVGSIILLSLIFNLLFKNIKIIYSNKNTIQIGAFCYLICVFVPLLPSGSFFNDYNLTLFCMNLSILYASNSQTNIMNFKN